mmetsp:Transcript_27211/g.50805  ORF Transcript_27211/g.50805 Transcript_27211/m.50805 type:complete len:259 (-) Transcript_27211:234-1010(-)
MMLLSAIHPQLRSGSIRHGQRVGLVMSVLLLRVAGSAAAVTTHFILVVMVAAGRTNPVARPEIMRQRLCRAWLGRPRSCVRGGVPLHRPVPLLPRLARLLLRAGLRLLLLLLMLLVRLGIGGSVRGRRAVPVGHAPSCPHHARHARHAHAQAPRRVGRGLRVRRVGVVRGVVRRVGGAVAARGRGRMGTLVRVAFSSKVAVDVTAVDNFHGVLQRSGRVPCILEVDETVALGFISCAIGHNHCFFYLPILREVLPQAL